MSVERVEFKGRLFLHGERAPGENASEKTKQRWAEREQARQDAIDWLIYDVCAKRVTDKYGRVQTYYKIPNPVIGRNAPSLDGLAEAVRQTPEELEAQRARIQGLLAEAHAIEQAHTNQEGAING